VVLLLLQIAFLAAEKEGDAIVRPRHHDRAGLGPDSDQAASAQAVNEGHGVGTMEGLDFDDFFAEGFLQAQRRLVQIHFENFDRGDVRMVFREGLTSCLSTSQTRTTSRCGVRRESGVTASMDGMYLSGRINASRKAPP